MTYRPLAYRGAHPDTDLGPPLALAQTRWLIFALLVLWGMSFCLSILKP